MGGQRGKGGKESVDGIIAKIGSDLQCKKHREVKEIKEKKGRAPVRLESWDPEYHHLNGPPPVHATVEIEESKPKPINVSFSSCWAKGTYFIDPRGGGGRGGGQSFLFESNPFFSWINIGPIHSSLYNARTIRRPPPKWPNC